MNWILTDDASKQHVFKISETEYRLIEMSLINPDDEIFLVYVDDIDLTGYLNNNGNANERLVSILNIFGYENAAHVRAQYGTEANQVMCECIFEVLSYEEGITLFHGTEEECSAFISDYISRR